MKKGWKDVLQAANSSYPWEGRSWVHDAREEDEGRDFCFSF